MQKRTLFLVSIIFSVLVSCNNDDNVTTEMTTSAEEETVTPVNTNVNFQHKTTIVVGGEGSAEITAYDSNTQKIFTVNTEINAVAVTDISNLDAPISENSIDVSSYGVPNSVAVNNGRLAVAVETPVKQDPGKVLVFNTSDNLLLNMYTVGSLPDMVTFTPDGSMILVANEGEPNDDYTIDPEGTISIIDLEANTNTMLNFQSFNGDEMTLESQGFRVFGPNANLATDVEPEYISVSDNGNEAWVSLQENNGIAKINLVSKTIEAIYPLGFKDYNLGGNEMDASDKDNAKELKSWPVYGMYQPDAITYVNINGIGYVISANEGDARGYDGFNEEERIEDLTLDEAIFPIENDYQNEVNLGRLEVTSTLGDIDNDGDYDQLYSYGARSFSIWSEEGNLLYDSGNSIAIETLNATPDRFNDDDKRSDAKGAEPESVTVLNIENQRYILFVGLERNDQVLVYDITNPSSPTFLSILSHTGDEAPEGLLVVSSEDSPSGKALLVVSNEDSGTVTIYENNI